MANKENKIKIIFAGTPEFALPSLRALLSDPDFEISAIITQPDKKSGRGQKISQPPVKIAGLKSNILVFQPDKIAEIAGKISALKPDLMVVVAYAQIIPENIISLPRLGTINVHGSLLPRHRGAACVQAAILKADKKTGVTIMKMDKGLDTGAIIMKREIAIADQDAAGSLMAKLADLGAEILPLAIKEYAAGKIIPEIQDNALATYAPKIKKGDGRINWQQDAAQIKRLTRAMNPWPGAFFIIKQAPGKEEIVKIMEAENIETADDNLKIGEIFLLSGEMAIKCNRGALVVKKIKPEGRKEMSGQDFLNGRRDLIGQILE